MLSGVANGALRYAVSSWWHAEEKYSNVLAMVMAYSGDMSYMAGLQGMSSRNQRRRIVR